jgi:hypothetical protein
MINGHKQFWFLALVAAYVILGFLFGYPYRRELSETWDLMRKTGNLQREEKNLQYYGAIYLAIDELRQTSVETKILFVAPDMNWVPRMMVFLYPRYFRTASTPTLALQYFSEDDFDYVVVYVELESYSGIIGNLNYFQQNYWTDEGMTEFLYALPGLSGYSKKELVELIEGSYGVLVYSIVREES